jgi:hypothetical protein
LLAFQLHLRKPASAEEHVAWVRVLILGVVRHTEERQRAAAGIIALVYFGFCFLLSRDRFVLLWYSIFVVHALFGAFPNLIKLLVFFFFLTDQVELVLVKIDRTFDGEG